VNRKSEKKGKIIWCCECMLTTIELHYLMAEKQYSSSSKNKKNNILPFLW